MSGDKTNDLTKFLATNPSKRGGRGQAWCCTDVPRELMAQVEATVAADTQAGRPIRWKAINDWLVSKGVTNSRFHRLQYHFNQLHHEHD